MAADRWMARIAVPVIGITAVGCGHFQAKKDKALIDAITMASPTKVQEALRLGANPNVSVAEGGTNPLLLAIARKGGDPKARQDIIQLLLAAGADPARQQKDGFDALIIAASAKDAELCSRFCGMGLSPMRCGAKGVSAFHMAATVGDVDSLNAMLPFVKAGQIDSPTTDKRHVETALGMACLGGHLEAARWLLDHGANPNYQDPHGDSPLMDSVFVGNLDLVNLLIERGAQVDLPFENGGTALSLACLNGKLEIARTLISHGADINHQNRIGETAMMDAAEKGHDDLVELILKAGARADLRDKKGRTAADFAKVRKPGPLGSVPESAGE